MADDATPSHVRLTRSEIEALGPLSVDAKWLYAVLKLHCNRDSGEAWPSYDKLIAITGIKRQRIAAALAELAGAGWIERRYRFGASVVYTFPKSYSSSDSRTTDSSDRPTTDSPVVGTNDTLTSRLELSDSELSDWERTATDPKASAVSGQTVATAAFKAKPSMRAQKSPRSAKLDEERKQLQTHKANAIFQQTFGCWPTLPQMRDIAKNIDDDALWNQVLERYAREGQPPGRLDWILDRYLNNNTTPWERNGYQSASRNSNGPSSNGTGHRDRRYMTAAERANEGML